MTTQTQTDVLEGLYSFRNRAEIMAFLDQNPALVPVLQEAHTQIGLYFPGAPISLTFETDPDDATFDHIGLDVHTSLAIDSAFDALDRLDDVWGDRLFQQAHGKILIGVE